jgi:TIR domain
MPSVATLVISYSSVDRHVISAVVSLLQWAIPNIDKAVYWDGELEPGLPWFDQIKHYIDASPSLFVFWCDHARCSKEVEREFNYAFQKRKRVVPVLMDDTPLSKPLATIHSIDLRSAIRHPLAAPSGQLTAPLNATGTTISSPQRTDGDNDSLTIFERTNPDWSGDWTRDGSSGASSPPVGRIDIRPRHFRDRSELPIVIDEYRSTIIEAFKKHLDTLFLS